MTSLRIPLEIGKDGLIRYEKEKESIDANLRSLITTPKFSCIAEPEYGFVFNNLSFENFNENEGVVYNTQPNAIGFAEQAGLYEKKISGSSKNMNTFAAELRSVIEHNEPRLMQLSVTMTYVREEKNIYIVIKGIQKSSKEPYKNTHTIKVWN